MSRMRYCWLFMWFLSLLLLFPASVGAELRASFIDVGQGDAILVQCDGESMLVDAGPQEAGIVVNRYISETANITALKYVIATHSHDDHLFGMPDALKGLSVNTVYSSSYIPMTYWFGTILPVLENESLEVKNPQESDTIMLGGAEVQFVNVPMESDNENNHSIACRIIYGKTSLLLTADIEGEAEISMLKSGIGLEADILKVAHHGGNTSTCDAFLNAVNPKYAVISVGAGNPHGHPHQVVLDRLKKKNISIYRTDEFGTIVAVSNGYDWDFEVTKAR